jgi:hypothetical protein
MPCCSSACCRSLSAFGPTPCSFFSSATGTFATEAAWYIRPKPTRGLLVLRCSWGDPCPVTTCAGWYCAPPL